MAGRGAPLGGDLGSWLAEEGLAPEPAGSIADVPRVRSLLIAAAQDGRSMSYSELLNLLGHRFTRAKMRALCKTLDAIDATGAADGEPGLAVLVVRESDRLPGQGWWAGLSERGYIGPSIGGEAAAHVRALQDGVFAFWRSR